MEFWNIWEAAGTFEAIHEYKEIRRVLEQQLMG